MPLVGIAVGLFALALLGGAAAERHQRSLYANRKRGRKQRRNPAERREIVVTFSTIDHHRERRVFKTLEGARKYAQKKLGEHPDMGSTYAVGAYGDAKIEVRGCALAELFPERKEQAFPESDEQEDFEEPRRYDAMPHPGDEYDERGRRFW
jgi:hypothetical protein